MTPPAPSLPPPQRPRQRPRMRRAVPPLGSLRAVLALVLREMVTTYGRSPGGYLWAVLEPVAGIALLTLIFSAWFDSPALGISFAMFYATGMLPFILFTDVSAKVSQSLNYSKQLLAYPRVTFIDALLARFALNLMTQLLVSYIVLGGIILFLDTRVVLDGLVLVQAYALSALLALGIGTFNCYMTTRFDVYQRAWGIAMRPLFILSCVFFLFDAIPQPYQSWLWYNPLVHVVGQVRHGFYPTYDASYVTPLYVVLVSLSGLAVGLALLKRDHKSLLER